MMGQLARDMKHFTSCVHRSYPEKSEYHTLHLLLGIISRRDHEGDDADGSLNQQEKSRRNKEHAKRIIRSHPSETVSTSTGSNLTSRRQSDSSPILRHRGEEKSRLSRPDHEGDNAEGPSRPDHEGDNAGRSLDQQKKTRRQTTQRRQGEEEPRPDHKARSRNSPVRRHQDEKEARPRHERDDAGGNQDQQERPRSPSPKQRTSPPPLLRRHQGEKGARPRHEGGNRDQQERPRSPSPKQQTSPPPLERRLPLERRQNPIKRRWSRTRDEKEDMERRWPDDGSYSSTEKRRNVEPQSEHSTSTRSTQYGCQSNWGKGSKSTWRESWQPPKDKTTSHSSDSRTQQWPRVINYDDISRSPKRNVSGRPSEAQSTGRASNWQDDRESTGQGYWQTEQWSSNGGAIHHNEWQTDGDLQPIKLSTLRGERTQGAKPMRVMTVDSITKRATASMFATDAVLRKLAKEKL